MKMLILNNGLKKRSIVTVPQTRVFDPTSCPDSEKRKLYHIYNDTVCLNHIHGHPMDVLYCQHLGKRLFSWSPDGLFSCISQWLHSLLSGLHATHFPSVVRFISSVKWWTHTSPQNRCRWLIFYFFLSLNQIDEADAAKNSFSGRRCPITPPGFEPVFFRARFQTHSVFEWEWAICLAADLWWEISSSDTWSREGFREASEEDGVARRRKRLCFLMKQSDRRRCLSVRQSRRRRSRWKTDEVHRITFPWLFIIIIIDRPATHFS